MNCPSRTDEVGGHPEWNQNPSPLSNDLTTRQDLNGLANLRVSRKHLPTESPDLEEPQENDAERQGYGGLHEEQSSQRQMSSDRSGPRASITQTRNCIEDLTHGLRRSQTVKFAVSNPFVRGILNLASFVGPGFLVAVAYIDPGNYSTDVSAGADTKFRLLFIALMSNIFAVVLQSLSIRLGTVTGKNLSEHCRAHLPTWLNIAIYILAEAAIIATDVAEVRIVIKTTICWLLMLYRSLALL